MNFEKMEKVLNWAKVTRAEDSDDPNDVLFLVTPIDQAQITSEQILDLIALDASFVIYPDEECWIAVRPKASE